MKAANKAIPARTITAVSRGGIVGFSNCRQRSPTARATFILPLLTLCLQVGTLPGPPMFSKDYKVVHRISALETPGFVMHFYTCNAAPSYGQCLNGSETLSHKKCPARDAPSLNPATAASVV